MVELLHETKDFYQLKELEKIAPKAKGIGQSHTLASSSPKLDDLPCHLLKLTVSPRHHPVHLHFIQ